jgi:5-methylcytosine-specific restriction endonuclease McrBC GTP-binding regulatory subunit McrB
MDIDKIKQLLLGNNNIILTGAPGTGKTYLAKKVAEAIGASEKSIKMVQFHPSYDYTDFVEGLRPIKEGDTLGFQRKDGVFKAFCKEALKYEKPDVDSALAAFHSDLKKNGFRFCYMGVNVYERRFWHSDVLPHFHEIMFF